MVRNIASRLVRIEAVLKPARRQFIVWDDGDDAAAAMQRLRDEHGPIRDDEFVVISWRAPQQ